MTTNCNDTCDAVDITCSSVILLETNEYVGLNSNKFVCQYLDDYYKNGFLNTYLFFHLTSSNFQSNPLLGHLLLKRYCIAF